MKRAQKMYGFVFWKAAKKSFVDASVHSATREIFVFSEAFFFSPKQKIDVLLKAQSIDAIVVHVSLASPKATCDIRDDFPTLFFYF